MKLSSYIMDKLFQILIYLLTSFLIIFFLFAFNLNINCIFMIIFLLLIQGVVIFSSEYLKKRRFYNNFLNNLDKLDKKYLIIETLEKPKFYDAELFINALYDINKSMTEEINTFRDNINDYKEYVEMWIHEVKIPIASLTLMMHNNKEKKYNEQLHNLENYIEQILYYVRSENSEKDYHIKKINLKDMIKSIALKNKDDILENNIDFMVNIDDKEVLTDTKWMEFILNQIINNSIKYKKSKDAVIKIDFEENKYSQKITIYDNGVGISESDIKKVFQKTFTGENGRLYGKSTGMGLYIAKNLCTKLGHSIDIKSKKGEYTSVSITIYKNTFLDLKN